MAAINPSSIDDLLQRCREMRRLVGERGSLRLRVLLEMLLLELAEERKAAARATREQPDPE